mgnify:CR=1 FL=1|tara:strand:+ start:146 stop:841 length:696 start_codon:yes stop_codon:yes gene_type:complete
MKKNTFKISAVAAMLVVASPLYAQTMLDSGLNLNTSASSNSNQMQTNTNVDASVNAGTNMNDNDGTTTITTENGVEVQLESDSQDNSDASINLDGAGTINVNTEANAESDIETSVFIQELSSENSRIQSVTVTDSEVMMEYKQPVKVFGFFNASMTNKAKVMMNESGERVVEVSEPWWSAFVSSRTASKADISSSINANLDAQGATAMDANSRSSVVLAIESAFRSTVGIE